jgi:hypothetical protein
MLARMRRFVTMAALVLAGLATAAVSQAAASKPALCRPANILHTLIAAGRLTVQDVKFGETVDLVRCGDVTADGRTDAVFTVASGGTAGDTRFGVLSAAGSLILYKQGYKVGIARVSRRAFDVIQPHYGRNEPNCCPGSFRIRRYRWTGSRFKPGHVRRSKTAPRRFYRR